MSLYKKDIRSIRKFVTETNVPWYVLERYTCTYHGSATAVSDSLERGRLWERKSAQKLRRGKTEDRAQ